MLITASNRLSWSLSALIAGAVLLTAGSAFAVSGKDKDKGGNGATGKSSSAGGNQVGAANAASAKENGSGSYGKEPKPLTGGPGKPFAYGVHDCRGGGCKGPLPGTNPPAGPGTTALAANPDEDICGSFETRGVVLYSRWIDASAVPDSVRRVRCR